MLALWSFGLCNASVEYCSLWDASAKLLDNLCDASDRSWGFTIGGMIACLEAPNIGFQAWWDVSVGLCMSEECLQ